MDSASDVLDTQGSTSGGSSTPSSKSSDGGDPRMKLWHDDVRPPPDASWTWARSNGEAKDLLYNERVEECSLDHDMGYEGVDIPENPDWDEIMDIVENATPRASGLELVHWMVETGNVPPKVTIHSWNPDGAKNMAARLNRFGHDCVIAPFKVAT